MKPNLNDRRFVFVTTMIIIGAAIFGALYIGRGRVDSQTVKRAMKALGFIESVTATQSVQWDANPPSDNVTNYMLKWGPAPGSYPSFMDVGTSTTGTINFTAGETRYVIVTAKNAAGIESGSSSEIIIGGTPTPLSPTPTATATFPPSPTPTATATFPPSPTPTATATVAPNAITVIPASLQFVMPNPSPKTIQVITSNGAPWTAFDACTWLDAQPQSGGPSGTSLTVTVTNASAGIGNPCTERFSGPGLPDKLVQITITANPTPTATAIRTPTPRPTATAIKTPTPSPTKTPTPRPTATATASATASATFTPTATASATLTATATATATASATVTATATPICWCATPCPPKPLPWSTVNP